MCKGRPHLSKMPPHFYGQLCKTVEGYNLLKKKGYFMEFIKTCTLWKDSTEYSHVMHLKAALWAIVIYL